MNSKGRPLHLLKYLYEFTDEDHPVSTADLMAFYEQHGFTMNRNTIRDDIASLNEAGFEVVTERKDSNMYYMNARPFEKVEVRMLIDAVSSAQFICEPRSHDLIKKLARLSDSYADFPYSISAHKTDNCQMYYHVNEIEVAIREKKKLAFHYYDYLPNKQKVFRHDGAMYSVSPYALLWKDDRYSIIGWNDAREAVNTFRVDLMTDVSATMEDSLVEWIDKMTAKGNLGNWNVRFAGSKGTKKFVCRHGAIGMVTRTRKAKTSVDGLIDIGALRDPRDLVADIDLDTIPNELADRIRNFSSSDARAIRIEANMPETPLLIIYCIDGDSRPSPSAKRAGTRDDLKAPCDMIGLCFCIPGGKPNANYATKLMIRLESTDVMESDNDLEDNQ